MKLSDPSGRVQGMTEEELEELAKRPGVIVCKRGGVNEGRLLRERWDELGEWPDETPDEPC